MQVTVNPSALERRQVKFADGEKGRVYDHDALDRPVPSVSTVKDLRVDPDKEDGLQGWKNHFDGSTKGRAPHWREQRFFKGHRGTLVHFACLSQFGVERSEEEDHSEEVLKNYADYRPALNGDHAPLPYYGPPDTYDGDDPWNAVMQDADWATDAFNNDVCPDIGITEETVLAAEDYVLDTEYGYAGQADLVFDPPDGPTTLADIKTGSSVWDDVKYQTAAYAYAVPYDVERTMVIRLHPDSQTVEIQTNEDWDNTIRGYRNHFLSLADRFNQTKYPVTELDDE